MPVTVYFRCRLCDRFLQTLSIFRDDERWKSVACNELRSSVNISGGIFVEILLKCKVSYRYVKIEASFREFQNLRLYV